MRLSPQYIAAFLDCDGTIVAMKQVRDHCQTIPSYYIVVGFYSQNLSVLAEIKEVVGGNIGRAKSSLTYNLQLPPRASLACLKLVQPYLRIKAEQASTAIALQDNVVKTKKRKQGKTRQDGMIPQEVVEYRDLLWQRIRSLNKKDSEAFRTNRVNSVEALVNGVIPSQATEGEGSVEGVTTRGASPNSNLPQERPARKGRYSLSNAEIDQMDQCVEGWIKNHLIT